MSLFTKSMFVIALGVSIGLSSCSSDEPKNGDPSANGGYGSLGGNLITIGSTRDVTYTSCVLLGTVDFPKITSDHSYGVVYMEALQNPNFDYDTKLQYGGHSGKNDKETYECDHQNVTNSAADGKFEKQLVDLKPATTYYYRAFVRIGSNVNYSNVASFTTMDPTSEITMTTNDATDIYAVAATMNGVVNVGKLQDVNEDQEFGFIYTTAPQMSTPDKLTYEYYEEWSMNHYETEDEIDCPDEITTSVNLNGRISRELTHLKPGETIYYRTFFSWNGKYFYSPVVKSLTTLGTGEITVGTGRPTEITSNSATMNATVPFSSIGLDNVECGFMISKKYSSPSEFDLENAVRWADKYSYPDTDIYYVSTSTSDKDFQYTINGLDPETTYYICGYINLGEYDTDDGDKALIIKGNMQHFTTEKSTSGGNDGTITFSSTGTYRWTERNGVWTSGNKGVSNSTSTLYVTMPVTSGQVISFDYTVSSESGYDGLTVYHGNDVVISKISGEQSGKRQLSVNWSGELTLRFEYSKDGSADSGQDCATVSNFRIN